MKRLIMIILATVAGLGAAAQADERERKGDGGDEIFAVVEQDPEFEGGMEGLYQYLAAGIKYPADAKAEGVEGRVYVSFVIEKDGRVSNVKVVGSPDERLSREAERVVAAMPKWRPGRQRGKRVRVLYTLPINFRL